MLKSSKLVKHSIECNTNAYLTIAPRLAKQGESNKDPHIERLQKVFFKTVQFLHCIKTHVLIPRFCPPKN